jgi:16S rRNA (guanine(966)-N(2))-methyltransferase RsmD
VRESIFARLGSVDGCRVLDLFAGTGALGIEAVSRGANRLVAVDRSTRSLAVLRKNLEKLGIAACAEVMGSEARGALRKLGEARARFDLVFLDPPYDADLLADTLEALVASGVLETHGVVVVESAKRHPVAPVIGLAVESERVYGDTVISWLVHADEPTVAQHEGSDSDGDGGSVEE